jgi:hypothetical protein
MKIVITENKFNEGVLRFINSVYDVDRIGWTYGLDDWGNEVGNAAEFYLGDYVDDNVLFKWYGEGYWNSEESENWGMVYCQEMANKSPMLVFESDGDYYNLEGLFGNRWKPVFIKWFEDNFGLPVKTITR